MKKKQYLSLLATLAAVGIAGSFQASSVQADGGEDADKSLLPVVFMTLDTSGSMRAAMGETGNSRLSQALQELTGTVKVKSSDPTVYYSEVRLPRKQLKCSSESCNYETVWVCGESYPHKEKCDHIIYSSYSRGHSQFIEDTVIRKLINGFDSDDVSKFASSYTNNGIIHSYMNTVKFGFATMYCSYPYNWYNGGYEDINNSWRYGFGTQTVEGYTNGSASDSNGDKINYVYGFNGLTGVSNREFAYCNGDGGGIWNADISGPTPLQYPTPSDDPVIVRASNEALIYNVRTFNISAQHTPLGEMVEDMSIMFNNGGAPDPGLITQPKPGAKPNDPAVDSAWRCRAKGVIAMTDGYPSTTVSSENAAYALFTQRVKVYAVAYANSTAHPNDRSVGNVMNRIAWKGGTCREYGHTGNIIHPNDTEGYEAYLKNVKDYPSKYTSCFYNAYNGIALRQAMQAIMNELLQGYTSKSKMVTTTAVGKLTTLDGAGNPTNGWYNVYSGYKIDLGSMRNSGLQREAYVCNEGHFKYDKNLYIDMAKKLNARLEGCRASSIFTSSSAGPIGDCIKNRAIFVGDYSSETNGFSTGRYALKPNRIHFSDSNAGVFYYETVDSSFSLHKSKYQFFSYNNDLYNKDSYLGTLDIQLNSVRDNDNDIVTNYLISPYECITEVDCLCMDGDGCLASDSIDEQYMCDKGKCVKQANFQSLTSCTSNLGACGSNGVCLNGQCRSLTGSGSGSCKKHSDCMSGTSFGSSSLATQNQVCHAGQCVNGVLIDGDIRDLIASIPLGAIEYASPVIVGPPAYNYHGADYVTYKRNNATRDTMMYVPANDGMLHAFILGKNNNSTYDGALFGGSVNSPRINKSSPAELEGEELWAFIPKAVMKDIHSLTDFGEQKKINVSPVYADVQFPNGSGGGDWHSVIVGGFREGGRGYYALDVTDPKDPKILWEIDHQWQSDESDAPLPELDNGMAVSASQEAMLKADKNYPFIRMGYSYPEALITNVIVKDKDDPTKSEVVPVAVLAGGVASGNETSDCNSNKDCAPDVTGKAVFVVRLNPSSKDDLLVREFQFDTRISGTPAAFPAGFNSIARVIYVGDENGALHRLDVSDPDMDNWKIDGISVETKDKVAKAVDKIVPIFDPNHIDVLQGSPRKKYEKVTYKPAVSALTSTGFPDIEIVFGSGDSSNTAIDVQDLNYTAIAVDHYVNDTIGYQLNNFNEDPTADAKTVNLNPLVIVFNPTYGIKHRDLGSYPTPKGNQYFEVWAGKTEKSKRPCSCPDIDEPDDFCYGCSEEECGTSASCADCPHCGCLSEKATCEVEKEICEHEYSTCVKDYNACKDVYKACVTEHNTCEEEKTAQQAACIENKTTICKENCYETKPCNQCEVVGDEVCEAEVKQSFCAKLQENAIYNAITYLWGSGWVCDNLVAKVRKFIEDYTHFSTESNYCYNKVKKPCDAKCDGTTYWESKVGYAEAYGQCLVDWAGRVSSCVSGCGEAFNRCTTTSHNDFLSCRHTCHWYDFVSCGIHNLGCDASYVAKLAVCTTVAGVCTADCTIGQIAYCTAEAIRRMILGCKDNCTVEESKCNIQKEKYNLLLPIYKKYHDDILNCREEYYTECNAAEIACKNECDTECKDIVVDCPIGVCPDCEDKCISCTNSCEECPDCTKPVKPPVVECTCPNITDDDPVVSVGNDNIRPGQKMMGPALTYNFRSYFPTYNAVFSDTDSCNDGFASIWMFDDRVTSNVRRWTAKSSVQNGASNRLSISGSTDNGKSASTFASHYINLANGTKVYGLAMTPQAICVSDGHAEVVAPQLIAQTGRAPGTTGGSEAASNDFSSTSDGLTDKDVTDIKVLSITEDAIKAEPDVLSWASVYE